MLVTIKFSPNNVLKEYNYIKEAIKNMKTSTVHQRFNLFIKNVTILLEV